METKDLKELKSLDLITAYEEIHDFLNYLNTEHQNAIKMEEEHL